ncbi:hypothetical protein [Spirosoma sp.]|uniref:hypothetical protein n=1 Tax=Spirosoma sp. TaxID=1899569 RepID=UPI003B3BAB39
MNSFLKITTSALSFAFCIGLSSCEKDALLTPPAPTPKSADIAPETAPQTITPTIPKKYTLVKQGEYMLTYKPDGRLASVRKGAKRTTFEYKVNPTRIIAYSSLISYNGGVESGGVTLKITTLYLNNDNMALRSEVITHDLTTGQFSTPQKFGYVYENKRLVKCYNVEDPNAETTVFGYDTNGDLSSVKVETNGRLVYSDQYTYGNRGIPQADLYPLNPTFSFFGQDNSDGTALMFLPVFGKFNKHLVQTITRTQTGPAKVLFNYGYKYNLNADGYVTDRERWNQTTNQKIETETSDYKVESVPTKL